MKTDLPYRRLKAQQLIGTSFKTPLELLKYMGIIQAQDPLMVKWALGLRLPHLQETQVEEAYRSGGILRTHVLRPTWHLVSPDDIYWMLDLCEKRVLSAMNSFSKQLQLDADAYSRCNRIIEKALEGGKHLNREAICQLLTEQGIQVNEYRSGLILGYAETTGLICSGPIEEGKHTYALLQERVPKAIRLDREESISRLASIYFRSHGPATVADFSWWSGLSLGEARRGLDSVKKELDFQTLEGVDYWFNGENGPVDTKKSGVILLPAFDEYMISYKDRSAMLPEAHYARAISGNGIFWPVILKDGKAIGTWKREVKRNHVQINAMYFRTPDKDVPKAVEMAGGKFADFLYKEARVTHVLPDPGSKLK